MTSLKRTDGHPSTLDATAVIEHCEDFDRAAERIAVSIIKLAGWIGVVLFAAYELARLITSG